MNALDIRNHLWEICDWVDPEKTVDRVITGDGEKEISNAIVTWISSFDAVREAARRGADLLITHEPTFYRHCREHEQFPDDALAREKNSFIKNAGLTVLRIHDSWDRFPEVGIPFAWAKFLGLEGPPVETGWDGYLHAYDIKQTTAIEFAERIAKRTGTIGEPVIQFSGDPSAPVTRVGIGTGCACDPVIYREMGCDLHVVTDDGVSYWGPIQRSLDEGFPVVRVNHGTSEEPGMVTLTEYLNKTFPDATFKHLPHKPFYRAVGAK